MKSVPIVNWIKIALKKNKIPGKFPNKLPEIFLKALSEKFLKEFSENLVNDLPEGFLKKTEREINPSG